MPALLCNPAPVAIVATLPRLITRDRKVKYTNTLVTIVGQEKTMKLGAVAVGGSIPGTYSVYHLVQLRQNGS